MALSSLAKGKNNTEPVISEKAWGRKGTKNPGFELF